MAPFLYKKSVETFLSDLIALLRHNGKIKDEKPIEHQVWYRLDTYNCYSNILLACRIY